MNDEIIPGKSAGKINRTLHRELASKDTQIRSLKDRIVELEAAIGKHRENVWGNHSVSSSHYDKELYSVLKEGE
jgi:hypothetical protein